MKFKVGILGAENEIGKRLQSFLENHHSIEVKPIHNSANKNGLEPPPLPCGLDFVFCAYQPDTALYSLGIHRAVFADIPIVALHGCPDGKLPILKIDCFSGDVFYENIPMRSYRRGICIMSKSNCDTPAALLVKISEFAISRSYLTQMQSVYYP